MTHKLVEEARLQVERNLLNLQQFYLVENEEFLSKLIINSQPDVRINDPDGWHSNKEQLSLTLRAPHQLFVAILNEKHGLEHKFFTDLRRIASGDDFTYGDLTLAGDTKFDPNWREQSGLFIQNRTMPLLESPVRRIWGDFPIRVFLSHLSSSKNIATRLSASLERYGVKAFVAHEDIKPNFEWERELRNALESMDALVALLTPGFQNSEWTDQEVGFALGAGVPTAYVSFGKMPHGFMARHQALGGMQDLSSDEQAARLFEFFQLDLLRDDPSKIYDAIIFAVEAAKTNEEFSWTLENLIFNLIDPPSGFAIRFVAAVNNLNKSLVLTAQLVSAVTQLINQWTGDNWVLNNGEFEQTSNKEVALEDEFPPEEDLPF